MTKQEAVEIRRQVDEWTGYKKGVLACLTVIEDMVAKKFLAHEDDTAATIRAIIPHINAKQSDPPTCEEHQEAWQVLTGLAGPQGPR